MKPIETIVTAAVVALVVTFGALFLVGGNQPENIGSGTRFPNGISADSTSPSAGEVRGTTLTTTGAATLGGATTIGGDVTVTTSNAATSTMVVGCVQTYATSTATAISLVFNAVATTSTTLNGQSNNGFVLWQYGACPN